MPDIRQAKGLSKLYGVTLDDLIDYDAEVQEIQRVIEHTSQEVQDKIDWTKLWGQKYPILTSYQHEVDIPHYSAPLQALLQELKDTYHYSAQDAFLVLKDILAKLWNQK